MEVMLRWVYTIPAITLFCVLEYVIYGPAHLDIGCMVADEYGVLGKGSDAGSDCSHFQKEVVEVPLLGTCTKHELVGNLALTQG